ncbi:MAG: acyl-CoA thioesterase [Actinobacteria bacterium]|nr:acyl-CoA thioesterase [Actinomycetota bacterium]
MAAMARPYRVEVPLRWSDMDAYGHVNNVQYLRLLEDARVIGFREWFPDRDVVGSGLVVTHHVIEYLRPLVYRSQPVEVEMWVTRVAAASFDLDYRIIDPLSVGTDVYAVAQTGLAAFDLEAGRPRRLGDAAMAELRSRVGKPVAFRWVGK